MYRLPEVAPNGWANSKFKVSKPVLIILVIFATAASLFNVYLNASQLSKNLLIGNVIVFVGAIIYSTLRSKYTTVEPSFEEM